MAAKELTSDLTKKRNSCCFIWILRIHSSSATLSTVKQSHYHEHTCLCLHSSTLMMCSVSVFQVCECWMEMSPIWWKPSLWAFTRSTSTSTVPAGGRTMTGRPWTGQHPWPDRPLRMASAWWACARGRARWETETSPAEHIVHCSAGMRMLSGGDAQMWCAIQAYLYAPQADPVVSTCRDEGSALY